MAEPLPLSTAVGAARAVETTSAAEAYDCELAGLAFVGVTTKSYEVPEVKPVTAQI
jgi:hypothetical protein